MGGKSAEKRKMDDAGNFVYDSEGNLIEDRSKKMKISYDWRGMPVEFVRQDVCENGKCASTRLTLDYDGSGRRISKTVWRKAAGESGWTKDNVTHYTGIGTEVRENFSGSTPGAKVVVSLPEGLGRYALGDASENADAKPLKDVNGNELAGMLPGTNFEWFLKNHLGSTMLVFGTQSSASPDSSDNGTLKAAYDYHAFGEQLTLAEPTDKVTENFTGKERDDEIELNYFGARYLDPMLGLWVSVDPARQFASPYLYAGNGMNPMNVVDPDGNYSLNLNEDNTVARLVQDDDANTVSVFGANGDLLGKYAAPPAESYFFAMTKGKYDILEQKFDFNMQQNANEMIDFAKLGWPGNWREWGTGHSLDFKHAYYNNEATVGVLNGTIMTARDVGNALWGGWTRYRYITPASVVAFGPIGGLLFSCGMSGYSALALLSNGYAIAHKFVNDKPIGLEDASSAAMQKWGYFNYAP